MNWTRKRHSKTHLHTIQLVSLLLYFELFSTSMFPVLPPTRTAAEAWAQGFHAQAAICAFGYVKRRDAGRVSSFFRPWSFKITHLNDFKWRSLKTPEKVTRKNVEVVSFSCFFFCDFMLDSSVDWYHLLDDLFNLFCNVVLLLLSKIEKSL